MLRDMREFRVAQIKAKKLRSNNLYISSTTKTPPETQYIRSAREDEESSRKNNDIEKDDSSLIKPEIMDQSNASIPQQKQHLVKINPGYRRHLDKLIEQVRGKKKHAPEGKRTLNAWQFNFILEGAEQSMNTPSDARTGTNRNQNPMIPEESNSAFIDDAGNMRTFIKSDSIQKNNEN